jgi:hypothetical protein
VKKVRKFGISRSVLRQHHKKNEIEKLVFQGVHEPEPRTSKYL